MTTRIEARFAELKRENRAALVTFVMAGDPDAETAFDLMRRLPEAGADLIELGMPFSDPMADGPAIQKAGLRALKGGESLRKTLATVARFRTGNDTTPVILMGYFNPIYVYGVESFVRDAKAAGVDGLIVVDLPPEMDSELCLPAIAGGLNFVRLATPTTDEARLPAVLKNTSGFLYYVSINGITGTAAPDASRVSAAIARIRARTDLPVCVGFGVRNGEQAAALAPHADGVVVGSALVSALEGSLVDGHATAETAEAVLSIVRELKSGIVSARLAAA